MSAPAKENMFTGAYKGPRTKPLPGFQKDMIGYAMQSSALATALLGWMTHKKMPMCLTKFYGSDTPEIRKEVTRLLNGAINMLGNVQYEYYASGQRSCRTTPEGSTMAFVAVSGSLSEKTDDGKYVINICQYLIDNVKEMGSAAQARGTILHEATHHMPMLTDDSIGTTGERAYGTLAWALGRRCKAEPNGKPEKGGMTWCERALRNADSLTEFAVLTLSQITNWEEMHNMFKNLDKK